MAVTDFDTKVGVVVRDDLAAWQRLNVTAFFVSGIVAIRAPHKLADGVLRGLKRHP
jgi:hypothetical protein